MLDQYFCGIDPGFEGAVAFIPVSGDHSKIQVFETPLNVDGSYDIPGMIRLLKQFRIKHLATETQQVMPKQGAVSGFKIGYGFGLWSGIIATLGIPMEEFNPKTWKKGMGILVATTKNKPDKNDHKAVAKAKADRRKANKAESVAKAGALFPTISLLPGKKRTPHDGIAEALLLAEWSRRLSSGQTALVTHIPVCGPPASFPPSIPDVYTL